GDTLSCSAATGHVEGRHLGRKPAELPASVRGIWEPFYGAANMPEILRMTQAVPGRQLNHRPCRPATRSPYAGFTGGGYPPWWHGLNTPQHICIAVEEDDIDGTGQEKGVNGTAWAYPESHIGTQGPMRIYARQATQERMGRNQRQHGDRSRWDRSLQSCRRTGGMSATLSTRHREFFSGFGAAIVPVAPGIWRQWETR